MLLAFKFLLFDCWPFDFLRTKCNMHGSLRSNSQSPLWLPTCSHFSRPYSRISVSLGSVSLSLSLSTFCFQFLTFLSSSLFANELFFFFYYLGFCVNLCFVFLAWCIHLSLSIFVEYYGVLCFCVVMWMFYLFSVCRTKLYLFWVYMFCCWLWLLCFFCLNVFKFCIAVFCCLSVWLPLCSYCVLIWVSPLPTDKENWQKNIKVAQISLVQDKKAHRSSPNLP